MIPLRDTQPSYSTPVVTLAIIIVNVAVFLYQLSLDSFSLNHFILDYAIIPEHFWRLGAAAFFTDGARLVTSAFLHGSWLHLIGNMWFLWIYGDNVEDILGRWRYVVFYAGCAILSGLVQVMASSDSRIPTLGASGAIAGVMGAYLIKFPHSRISTLIWVFLFVTVIEVPATLILVYWLVIQVVSSLYETGGAVGGAGGTAWFAHIGGFLAGIGLILVLRTHVRYRHDQTVHWK